MEGLEPPVFVSQFTKLVLSPLNHIGLFGCGRRIRTPDLKVMSLASYLCSIPQ
jgi:hypothetical protein